MAFLAFQTSSLAACVLLLSVGAGFGGSPMTSHPSPAEASKPQTGILRVYIGTYTQGQSKGIYLSRLDLANGTLSPAEVVAETTNPSFVAISPDRRFLYAVNEIGEFGGKRTGAVSAFALDPKTGGLTPLNQQPSAGDGPCHLSVDKTGKNVLVANYGGGSIAVLPVQADGSLGAPVTSIQHKGVSANAQRQGGPHAHMITLDAAERFALVPDLGLDKIFVYHFDANHGTLTPNTPPAGTVAAEAGPRHLAFHPNGHFAYVINEINCTVTVFAYDAHKGTLTAKQTLSTLPREHQSSDSTAEIQVSPDGHFLYGSNRGQNSIAIFSVDSKTGLLTYVGEQSTQGKIPRNFCMDPTGTYLLAANQDSDSIVVFRRDAHTGLLTPTGTVLDVPKPVCIRMIAE